MRRVLGPVALLLLLPFLAACGDSDAKSTDQPAPAPTTEPPLASRVLGDLEGITEVADAARNNDGSYPAGADDRRFSNAFYPSEGIRMAYRANADRSQYRVCVQARKSGPWAAWDTARGGLVAIGDSGTCTFRAPDPASTRGVRTDLARLYLASQGYLGGFGFAYCDELASDAKLHEAGVLSKGNRIGSCTDVDYQDGDVPVAVYCVQHGKDGAWATYDSVVGTAYAASGSCLADLDDGDQG
ncbi:MAG TPA: hypothetical protein VM575_00225 [Nocardioides sp.]|nr:hypothetical protein [Nocardioides sp.]